MNNTREETTMNTMIFCESWWDAISTIPVRNNLRLCAVAALLNYGFYGTTPEDTWEDEEVPSEVQAIFSMAKPIIDNNIARFKEKIQKNHGF